MKNLVIEHLQAKTDLSQDHTSRPSELIWYKSQNTFTEDKDGKLTGINLCGQNITDADIQKLFKEDLSKLVSLNLSENQLTEIRIPSTATALQHINVSENPDLKILELGGTLPELETLKASKCALESFSLGKGFDKLIKLDLRQNKLTNITFEGDCPKLQELHIGANQLTSLSLPSGFAELKYLYLLDNQIEQITFASRLSKLKTLHLRNNKLKSLPRNIQYLDDLTTLYLHNNPTLDIPQEVLASGERANSRSNVIDYLTSLQKDDTRFLRQAKMILVGNGEVGKTSISLKLIDRDAELPTKEARTKGLDVKTYTIEKLEKALTDLNEDIDFQMSIWDFGGQGKYREVQQLFCSRKSLYIFVTSPDDSPQKQYYVGFEYWLSMVRAYGYDESDEKHSPIIHVVNKIDKKPLPINQKDRLDIFPSIHPEFIEISCKTLRNFDDLEKAIRTVLRKVSDDIFTNKYSELWMNVKEELEQREEHHIMYTEYEEICKAHQMNESEARTWIGILDRIGTVIYFGDDPLLKDWVILNPAWVKDAIYEVLDDQWVLQRGSLQQDAFERIWSSNTPEEREKFVALMKAYMLCYEQKDTHGFTSYVIPALLPKQKPFIPPHLQNPTYQLKLVFDPFIPAGTINRLIVSLQQQTPFFKERYIQEESQDRMSGEPKGIYTSIVSMWRNNVIIHDPIHNAYVHLEEAWEDQAVYLNLFGKDVKPLYEYVLNILTQLNKKIQDAKFLNKLSLCPEAWYEDEWTDLKKLERTLKRFNVDFFQDQLAPSQPKGPIDQIKELLAQGRVELALNRLASALSAESETSIIALRNRWSTLSRDKIQGVIRQSDSELEHNKIVRDILALCAMNDKREE